MKNFIYKYRAFLSGFIMGLMLFSYSFTSNKTEHTLISNADLVTSNTQFKVYRISSGPDRLYVLTNMLGAPISITSN